MSKKSWPNLYSNMLNKRIQDFLDRQYDQLAPFCLADNAEAGHYKAERELPQLWLRGRRTLLLDSPGHALEMEKVKVFLMLRNFFLREYPDSTVDFC